MGFVRLAVLIGRDDESLREVTALVYSGAFYTILPPALAQEMRIETPVRVPVTLADSRVVRIGLGVAYLRIEDREGGVPVGVMDVPEPLLGVTALEALGLKVNPVDGTVEHARPFGPAVL